MINKKIIMFVGMVLLVAGVAYASGVVFFGGNAYESNEDKLVLDMDLTEANYDSGTKTFTDDSGEGNDGVSVNAATFTTDKYGMSTGAMSFDGSTEDYISVPNSASLNLTTQATWSFWAKPFSSQSWNDFRIFSKTSSFDIGGINSGGTGLRFVINGNYANTFVTNGAFESNTWKYYTITFDNGTAKLYVNGTYLNQDTMPSNTVNSNTNSLIIGSYSGGIRTFNGSISQIKIYNRSLSATEVMALYNSSKPKASASSSQSGLVGHWELDSDDYNFNTNRTTDKTPYENHGTNYGATFTTDRMGHADKAMSFDGNYDRINAGSDSSLDITEKITIESWVNPTSYSQHYPIFVRKLDNYRLGLQGVGDGQVYFRLVLDGTTRSIGSSPVVPIGEWTHVVGTYDGSYMRIYINGELKGGPTAYNGSIGTTSSPLIIGAYDISGSYCFNGSIADVRIYDRALSEDEIESLYSSYRPKVSSGSLKRGLILDMPLKLKYTKDETVGSEIMTDRTPYSNDGTNHGASVGSSYSSFDGNDYIDVTDDSSLNPGTNNFSVGMWIKVVESAGIHGVLTKGYGPAYGIYYYLNELRLYIQSGSNNNGIGISSYYDEWIYVFWTIDNDADVQKSYLNGNFNTQTTHAVGDVTSGYDINLGRYTSSENQYFNGLISQVKIYNRVLSESEIKLLYDKGR